MMLQGVAASQGIGIGKALCLKEATLDYSTVVSQGQEAEEHRLAHAIETFEARTTAMAQRVAQQVGAKEAEILTGQVAMLADPFMRSQMVECIQGGACAEGAVDQICTMYADMFAGVEDEMMRQRATDVRDIRSRMLSILLGVEETDLSCLPQGTVLVVHDLTPSMTVGLDREHVEAIVTETGGRTSHSAILARAMELPGVLSVEEAVNRIQDGDLVVVDGGAGALLVNPDQETLADYEQRQRAYREERARLSVYRNQPTVDGDGTVYHLYANIGSPAQAEAAREAGAEGIGLFRTEFLFMDRSTPPTEEEQYEAYSSVSRTMAGKEVIIRTLDVGGDKAIEYLEMEREENPFLGHRAIRYCLDRPDLFKVQLRALLRAGGEGGNIKIMLPMVTSLEEIRSARTLLEECKEELKGEGLPYDSNIALGIMIETPAAAMIADILARECDFFSIGTNDLTQYTMAVDRGNAKVEKLYTTYHPGVLRSIAQVIRAGHEAGIPVGMCGEAAADPCLIPLLMEWGLDEFSVTGSSVLATRAQIHGWTKERVEKVAQGAMALATAGEIQAWLEKNTAQV